MISLKQYIKSSACFLLMLLMMGLFSSQAQVREAKEPELRKRLQGKATLQNVMAVVEAFYLEKGQQSVNTAKGEYENEYMHWKRWEYNTRLSTGPDGLGFDVNAEKMKFYEQQNRAENIESLASTPSWNFVGPSASSYATTPPSGSNGLGRCDRVAFHPTNPNIIFVGAPNGGLWKTINNGASWTCLTSYLPVSGISGIVISHADPNTIYILTGSGDDQKFTITIPGIYSSAGIFKSTDGGTNWVLLPLPWGNNPQGIAPYKLVQSPLFANKLVAATSNGVYFSDNAGASWTANFGSMRCFDVDFAPGTDIAWCALRTSTGLNIKRSINGGLTWANVSFGAAPNTPMPAAAVRISLAVTNVNYGGIELAYVFCGPVTDSGYFSGLYKTAIGGYLQLVRNTPNLFDNFPTGAGKFDQSEYDNCIAVSLTNSNIILTGGAMIFRSTNGGNNMFISSYYEEGQAGGDLTKYTHADIHDLAYNPLNNYVYAANDGGLHYSTDNGISWTNISNGINTSMFFDIAGLENNEYALLGGLQDNGSKYRGTNTANLVHLSCCDGFYNALSPTNSSLGYMSGNNFLIKHTNLGDGVYTGIDPTLTPGRWAWRMDTHTTNGNYVYASAGGLDSIWISNNAGASWFRRKAANGNLAIVTCPSNSTRVYVCGTGSVEGTTLKRTETSGETWSDDLLGNPGLPPLTGMRPSDVEVAPSNSNIVFMVYDGYNAGQKVYTSTNFGTDWTNISYNLPNLYYTTIAVDYNNNLYLGSIYGIFFKTAAGTQWQYYSNNLPRVLVTDLEINMTNGFLYAATYGRGIWKADLWGACENFYYFSGNQTGERVYEGNTIWSIAQLGQLQGTKILYKTADSTKLLNGFLATDDVIEFRATSGPCGSGFPSLFNITDSSIIDVTKLSLPSNTVTQFPFATIAVKKQGTQAELEIDNIQDGTIQVKITSKEGRILQELYTAPSQKAGKISHKANLADLKPDLYYIHLIHNGVLVHYQEYMVE